MIYGVVSEGASEFLEREFEVVLLRVVKRVVKRVAIECVCISSLWW